MPLLPLSIVVMAFSVLLAIGVIIQVAKKRLLLRYSLLWLLMAIMALICAIFPDGAFFVGSLLGFHVPSNFILFLAIFLLLAVSLSLSVVVSKQQIKIKNLVQDFALLKKEFETKDALRSDDAAH